MRSTMADRFLKRFAGDLKNRRKHPNSKGTKQNSETDVEMAVEPGSNTDETDCQKGLENNAEPIEKNGTVIKENGDSAR